MKKILFLLLFGLINHVFAQEQLFVNLPKDSVVRLNSKAQQFDFVPGEILIRYKDEIVVSNLKAGGIAQTGLTSVDLIFQKYKVEQSEKLFPNEQKLKSKVMLRGFNGQEFEQPSLHNIYKLKLDEQARIFDAITELKQDSNVIYAEPNYILSITNDHPVSPILTEDDLKNGAWNPENTDAGYMMQNAISNPEPRTQNPEPKTLATPPNDPLYSQQWYIPAVHANEVWDTITNDSTQVIAILDTGVDWLHPDLVNKIWTNPGEIPNNGIDDDGNGKIDDVRGWDWINNDNNPADDNSHGTHVAGIAAAQQNNGIGIAGVSKKARIMPLKVFQSSGRGDAATIAIGINYAKAKGATVINMSFGSYAQSLTMEAALANAYASCILVAAAGNDVMDIGDCPPGGPFFPAALSYVLGVMAPDGRFSNSDCTGPTLSYFPELYNYEMKAPGTNILSTIPNGNYRAYQGTSMAAPVISGSVAMYKSLFPSESQELMWVKLIQSTSSFLNLHQAIHCVPEPQLNFISNTMVDTLLGDDYDGRVDAGETIQLWYKVRNTGGQTDSAFVRIDFGEFEDTTTAQIINNQTFLGSISSYASKTNESTPFKIHINSNVANNRDIVFRASLWFKNSPDTATQQLVLNVENGEQLSGVMDSTLILTADKLWLVNSSFRVGINGILIINAGTHLILNSTFENRGRIYGNGTPDSLISITGTGTITSASWSGKMKFKHTTFSGMTAPFCGDSLTYNHCIFEDILIYTNINTYFGSLFCGHKIVMQDNIIRNSTFGRFFYTESKPIQFKRNNVVNILQYTNFGINVFDDNVPVSYNNFVNIRNFVYQTWGMIDNPSACFDISNSTVPDNNFIGNGKYQYFYRSTGSNEIIQLPNIYWGTTNLEKIKLKNYDFWKNPSSPMFDYSPIKTSPSDSAHALVWKVLVNNKDAQDEVPDPVGVGPQKFEIYFNRPMDTAFHPQVSFGVRYPYTQQAVTDSGHWSSDHKVWTAWKNIQLYTGDGINRIRIAGAKDLDGWEIPIEDMRFELVIQAAGSASTDFMAQAGIGKVYLEWNNAGIPDLLGFNLYRFKNITDTTYTTPLIINSTLITDTTYTDFAVNPGDHYWYYYKVVNTDFRESDSSNRVSAIPYNASIGDANGDGFVNVLDVTALIAYMLNQNPQPFLFDAADVNDDNTIDILDVIGVVNLITGKKKSISTSIGTNPLAAHIKLEDDRILLQNNGQIASMQFELAGEALENISLFEPPQGYELAYGIVKGKLLGILYTCSNNSIPAGSIRLVKIDGTKSRLEWGKILAGDKEGNRVPILKDESADQPNDLFYLQAYPNPFTQSVTINFRLSEDFKTEIRIYTMHGKLVNVLLNKDLKEGLHWIDWNGRSGNGNLLPSGIYLCTLEGINPGSEKFSKTIKIIFNK